MRLSLQQVDMFDASSMRYFSSPSALAATAAKAGVRPNLISLVPWWKECRMLILVPGGKADPAVLRRVVS